MSSWGKKFYLIEWILSLLLLIFIILCFESDECVGRPRLNDNFGFPDDSKIGGHRRSKFYINNVPDIQCPEGTRMSRDGICRNQTINRTTFGKHRHQHGTNNIRENEIENDN